MANKGKSDPIASSLRGSVLPFLAYIMLIGWPMPLYLRFLPGYILLPIIFVVPIIWIAYKERRAVNKSPVGVWGWITEGWAAALLLTYARALDVQHNNQAGLWYWIGGGLVFVWLAILAVALLVRSKRVDKEAPTDGGRVG